MLPQSTFDNNTYDALMTCTDKLTKMVTLIPAANPTLLNSGQEHSSTHTVDAGAFLTEF
jgi:hypothetical protein